MFFTSIEYVSTEPFFLIRRSLRVYVIYHLRDSLKQYIEEAFGELPVGPSSAETAAKVTNIVDAWRAIASLKHKAEEWKKNIDQAMGLRRG